MANTTNYNWETPDDTDLVKDGAAAIRTLGSSVDTTTKALNPSTTLGDIEYRSATANTNTRLGIGTTGQVLTVAGGVPTWATSDDANAIQNAIVDAKGDLIAASAADTPARLAVGTNNQRLVADSAQATGLKYVSDTQNTVIDAAGDLVYGTAADTLGRLAIGTAGQVLKVNSGATAPEWGAAGGASALTYVGGSTFSGVSSVSVNDVFSTTYDNYIIYINAALDSGGAEGGYLRLRVSGSDDSNTVYNEQQLFGSGSSANAQRSTSQNKGSWSDINTNPSVSVIQMFSPFATAKTSWQANSLMYGGASLETQLRYSTFTNTTSFTGFSLIKSGASNMSGTIKVYGLANS